MSDIVKPRVYLCLNKQEQSATFLSSIFRSNKKEETHHMSITDDSKSVIFVTHDANGVESSTPFGFDQVSALCSFSPCNSVRVSYQPTFAKSSNRFSVSPPRFRLFTGVRHSISSLNFIRREENSRMDASSSTNWYVSRLVITAFVL